MGEVTPSAIPDPFFPPSWSEINILFLCTLQDEFYFAITVLNMYSI